MLDQNCIFCKIIEKKIPSKIITENETIIVIQDISPKAPIHYLIFPKKHIININYLTEQDSIFALQMFSIARDIAKDIREKNNLKEPLAFNLISNNGAEAGQSVFHMHMHFIAGKNLYDGGLKL